MNNDHIPEPIRSDLNRWIASQAAARPAPTAVPMSAAEYSEQYGEEFPPEEFCAFHVDI